MQTINPDLIIELHPAGDEGKLSELIESMKANGWQGRPILVHDDGNGFWAWTGSHRVAAAKIAGVDVPIHLVDMDALNEFCEREWMTFDELGDDRDREWALEEMGDEKSLTIMRQEPNL